MPDRIIRRLDGPRGGFLLLMSVGYMALSLSYVAGPATASRMKGFAWLPQSIDANELGWAWVAVALLAFAGAWWGRQCRRIENWAFGGLILPPSLWAAVFVIAWVVGEHPTGWITAVSYGLYTSLAWHAASWPNPPSGGGDD